MFVIQSLLIKAQSGHLDGEDRCDRLLLVYYSKFRNNSTCSHDFTCVCDFVDRILLVCSRFCLWVWDFACVCVNLLIGFCLCVCAISLVCSRFCLCVWDFVCVCDFACVCSNLLVGFFLWVRDFGCEAVSEFDRRILVVFERLCLCVLYFGCACVILFVRARFYKQDFACVFCVRDFAHRILIVCCVFAILIVEIFYIWDFVCALCVWDFTCVCEILMVGFCLCVRDFACVWTILQLGFLLVCCVCARLFL